MVVITAIFMPTPCFAITTRQSKAIAVTHAYGATPLLSGYAATGRICHCCHIIYHYHHIIRHHAVFIGCLLYGLFRLIGTCYHSLLVISFIIAARLSYYYYYGLYIYVY